ncbi:MAG: MoaD/ThiS family protein [Candidatus Bathyarchaeia archaeon]
MKVRVKFFGEIRSKIASEDLWMHFKGQVTLKTLLAKLEKEHKMELENRNTIILVNGRHVKFDATLNDMDEVVIFPVTTGG